MASNFSDNATASGSNDVDPEMGDYVVVELKGEMSLRREPWDILPGQCGGEWVFRRQTGHQDVGN
ncbi:hypothetical protein Q7C36_010597 [Tachysurus vachellii]|uniref:Uncharacterized protein n=1 Tax=Tachysurus vachellii TaxID=175792 RepID=A0AA88MZ76_TACVA|nr:hypothetical protein Q7C36_010597 [Tachysurus vachellii]